MRLSVLLATIAACGGPAFYGLRFDAPNKPQPEADVDWADLTFKGADGLDLYAQRWRPRTGDAKAVVVIHHGFADHSGRYSAFATALVRAGYDVWAFDMRGHGRSAGERVSIERAEDLLGDLDAFVTLVRREEPDKPMFLYGHSVGGHVVARYAMEYQPKLAGLVVASPAIVLQTPPLQIGALPLLDTIAHDAPLFDLPHAWFSHRPEVVAEMNADPLISQVKGPAHTPAALALSAEHIWAHPEQLVVPLLAVHGSADRATAPSGSRDLVARAGSTDKTLRIYDGLAHDTLREPNGAGERVSAEIIQWLDAHSGGPAIQYTSTPRLQLTGDSHGHLRSLELDARGELPRSDADHRGLTAGFRLRLGGGRIGGVGFQGGLDLRGGALNGGYYEADAYPLGVALRGASGLFVAITGGIGIGGVRSASATHVPVEVSLEVPAGPTRVLARGSVGWKLSGDAYTAKAVGNIDELSAMAGIRIGRDHRLWNELTAGDGPFVALTYRNLGGSELYGLAVGLDVWEGD